jgi:hypothetical protein
VLAGLVDQLSELLQRLCALLQPPFRIRRARGTGQVPGPDGPRPAAQPLQALLLLIQLSLVLAAVNCELSPLRLALGVNRASSWPTLAWSSTTASISR